MSSQQQPPPLPAQQQVAQESNRRLLNQQQRDRSDSAAMFRQQTASSGSTAPKPPPPIYLLTPQVVPGTATRPMRPNLRRQVMVASSEAQVCAPIELASVLTRAAVCAEKPPKRPTTLPARYATTSANQPQQQQSLQVNTTGVTSNNCTKPNRYSWAQMQQWQAADRAQLPANQRHNHHFASPFSSAASRVLVVNPMQIVNLSEHTKSRLIKIIEALKRFSEQWFSHVLLLLFLAVYACFGAYIFISFEAPTEQWEKQLIIDARQQLVNESWSKANEMSKNEQEFNDYFRTKLEDYERLLNRACASGMTSNSLDNQWTFWGALFYSMTVFTTIGYGHLTPITFAGRVATMVYAIFGIPILLMVLADLGKLLTRIIKFTFKKSRYLFNKLLRRKRALRTRKLIQDNTNQYIGVARSAFERGYANYIHNKFPTAFSTPIRLYKRRYNDNAATAAAAVQDPNDHSQVSPEGLIISEETGGASTTDVIVTPGKQTKPVFAPEATQKAAQHVTHSHHNRAQSPSLSSTRNFQRVRKNSNAKRPTGNQKPLVGVPRSSSLSAVSAAAAQQLSSEKTAVELETTNNLTNNADHSVPIRSRADSLGDLPKSQQAAAAAANSAEQQVMEQDEEELEENDDNEEDLVDEEEDEDEFDIPVSFALFLLVTYMMFGAVVFSIWEGWNFFDSLYFVFISMSTIGFGDLVPQHPKRMIGTFIYLLFGLALTSMCINVVQEKIHATFLRAKMQIGEKMGLDLEQIMADDYYGDGNNINMSNGNMSNGQLVDCNDNLSLSAVGGDDSEAGGSLNTNSWHLQQTANQHHQWPQDYHHEGVKPSKSRDSIRSGSGGGGGSGRKRSPAAGLPGHNNCHSSGGSLRRKSSQRKISRQATPVTPSSSFTSPPPPVDHQRAPLDSPTTSHSPPATTITQPARPPASHLSPHSTLPIKAELQRQISDHHLQPALAPHINQPVQSGANLMRCEPLRNYSSQQKQPPQLIPVGRSLSSRDLRSNQQTPTGTNEQQFSADRKGITNRSFSRNRSQNSSRRSSVSAELNQLDDLIVALSKSPAATTCGDNRFGPLLGIPTPKQQRSVAGSRSPSPSIGNARRATSVTSRPTTPTSNALPRKKVSLGGSPQFQSSSSQVIIAPSLSPVNSRSRSESQRALDELESIKFSAV